jgi:hypothetical protein
MTEYLAHFVLYTIAGSARIAESKLFWRLICCTDDAEGFVEFPVFCVRRVVEYGADIFLYERSVHWVQSFKSF